MLLFTHCIKVLRIEKVVRGKIVEEEIQLQIHLPAPETHIL